MDVVYNVDVNYWAVLTGGVVAMILGSIWYGPLLGRTWMKYMGIKESDTNKDNVGMLYFWMFLAALVTCYILAHFIQITNADTFTLGMQTAFWLWLGFLAAGSAGQYLFPPKPLGLFILDSAYKLVFVLIAGGILAIWPV